MPRGAAAALEELERLAFVPAAQFSIPTAEGPALFQIREPLLFDRFEVRREQWLARSDAFGASDSELSAFVLGWRATERNLPVTFVTLAEAQRFAELRGMRLPSAAEWIVVAVGAAQWPYPWGMTRQKGVANTLELGLGQLAASGSFESGVNPLGIYDLHGNASEWATGVAPFPDTLAAAGRASAMGGSFRTYSRALLVDAGEPFGRSLPPGSRSDDLGFRCCVEAARYLWEVTKPMGLDPLSRERLLAIGRRWGSRALTLLGDLSTRPGAPEALRVLAEGAAQ
ncbi:MAG: SUMF1/EgtB/PvdO family nonheme iron enzyme [Planctomycetes bacterium]|nr:SUMF1/EgtB/PvdO family nonheme iron enzyme [Planctomycetota bacterium]